MLWGCHEKTFRNEVAHSIIHFISKKLQWCVCARACLCVFSQLVFCSDDASRNLEDAVASLQFLTPDHPSRYAIHSLLSPYHSYHRHTHSSLETPTLNSHQEQSNEHTCTETRIQMRTPKYTGFIMTPQKITLKSIFNNPPA